MGILLIILIAVVALVVFWIIAIYNRFVLLKNGIDNAWAQIDVQLKRRFDLIPNLVESVKGYAAHEKEVFERVTQARASVANAQTTKEQAEAQVDLINRRNLKNILCVNLLPDQTSEYLGVINYAIK